MLLFSIDSSFSNIIFLSVVGLYTDIISPGTRVQGEQQERRSRWRKSKVRMALSKRGKRMMVIRSIGSMSLLTATRPNSTLHTTLTAMLIKENFLLNLTRESPPQGNTLTLEKVKKVKVGRRRREGWWVMIFREFLLLRLRVEKIARVH